MSDPTNGTSSSSDLPFLVTHWLSDYGSGSASRSDSTNNGDEEKTSQQDAIERVQRATAELANAFADLGVFGVALNNPISGMNAIGDANVISQPTLRNASYGDVLRRWSGVSGRHLESLVECSSSSTAAVLNNTQSQFSTVDLAYDRERNVDNHTSHSSQQDVLVPNILHKPVRLIRSAPGGVPNINETQQKDSNEMIPLMGETKLIIGSDMKRVERLSAQASKRYISIRTKFQEEERSMRQIKNSLSYQQKIKSELDMESMALLSTQCASASVDEAVDVDDEQQVTSDSLVQKKLENERVLAQLGRRLFEIKSAHDIKTKNEMVMASSVAKALWKEYVAVGSSYSDPMYSRNAISSFHNSSRLHGQKSNSVLSNIIGRGYGVGIKQRKGSLRQIIGCGASEACIRQRNKALYMHRLSHVVTINSHLFCPVYCLRFDRSGEYFVTGADDNLVKLFRIGAKGENGNREKLKYISRNPEFSHHRGAILVCSLRGHASVITDIDVSADNALLATASEDGDVRVWGMTDGCPVAILRGHEGGANMVSWSLMTPFQLVSIGGDGLARMWDVREAAMKRCKVVRNRRDFLLPFGNDQNDDREELSAEQQDLSVSDNIVLPPLPPPPPPPPHERNQDEEASRQNEENGDIFVPPLPLGAEIGIGAEAAANNNRANGPVGGAFIANSDIDEGVLLLSRMQHGDVPEQSQLNGAGTRSRRKKVKVLCLSRCPIGGHFATGSDDGIGRIWLDDSNKAIDELDMESRFESGSIVDDSVINVHSLSSSKDSLQRTRSSSPETNNAPSTKALLASLHGHHDGITDIQYSSIGDRLITASQKDGVVRVWSWGNETSKGSDGLNKIDQIKQIFIRLEPPHHLSQHKTNTLDQRNSAASSRRRRTPSSQNSSIFTQCDVAAWTADDTKVITSQSCVAKQTDSDIIQGSHLLYVWDSVNGNCLIGFPGAHEKPCPVLSSHPLDSSIIVSGGADGYVKIWDLDVGKCVFSHRNKHDYGALENLTDRGKSCGYLDGSFSPDGLHLVLTDDTGRITIIDVLGSEEVIRDNRKTLSPRIDAIDESISPTWMKEQYFANDYYDLFYDASGYCIERGSRFPPHLSPEAARCMHTGHAYADPIQLAFSSIKGPMPLQETVVSLQRHNVRLKSSLIRMQGGVLSQNVTGKRNLIEARATTASHVGKRSVGEARISQMSPSRRPLQITERRRSNMSNRYRWIGFEEMERENNDDDEAETDDEEYQEGNRVRDHEPEEELLVLDDHRPRAPRRRNRNPAQGTRRRIRNHASRDVDELEQVIQNEPTRVSARQFSRRTDNQYVYDTDESDFEEMLSANTSPTGQYKEDYTELGHIYKLPSGGTVNRKWVRRNESVLGYTGWKTYCPQEGDKVVYIPMAHSQILRAYPVCETATGAPWKSWPKVNSWSAVVCEVKSIRYRFPYSGYYGSRSRNPIRSIVAILMLELTDIPRVSNDRAFPWAKAEFVPVPPTRSSSFSFEVSIFENGESDFVIPLQLYKWRIQSLEKAITDQTPGSSLGLTDFYVNTETEDSRVDPYSCQLLSTVNSNDQQELHFQESGFNTLHIQYESNDDNLANSWDVTINGTEKNCPLPTSLTGDQEKAVLEILDILEADIYVKATFSAQVNERSFVDYSMMIEVPMDTSIIRLRLQQKYYTNMKSVKADVRLIRDNCFKYNKMGSEITNEAKKLFDSFSSLLEENLGEIDCEPREREGSEEMDRAVDSIPTFRDMHPLDNSQPRSNTRRSQPQLSSLDQRPVRSRGREQSVAGGRRLDQGSSNRSQRANRRNESILEPPEAPRIRIMRRRQQEYISDEDSDSENDSGTDLENESAAVAGNIKIVVDGEEYVSSESEHESHDEQVANLRQTRNTRSRRQYISNSDENKNTAAAEKSDTSGNASSNNRQTSRNVDHSAKSRPRRPTRNSDRNNTARDKSEGCIDSGEPISEIVAVAATRRSTRSTRGTLRKRTFAHDEAPSDQESKSDSSMSETITSPIISNNRRITRSRVSVAPHVDDRINNTQSSSEDEVRHDTSEEEEAPIVSPKRRSGRSSRSSAKYVPKQQSDNEMASNEENSDNESSVSEEEMPILHRNRRNTRSANTRMPTTPTQMIRERTRSSPRRNQVQSLQETFTRRISANARATRSRHFSESAPEVETATLFRNRESRSSGVVSSTLENLPPSSPGGSRRLSARQKRSISTYHDFSSSDFDPADSEEDVPPTSPNSRRPTRKRQKQSPVKQAPKKRKRPASEEVISPQLDKWPGHVVKPEMMHDVCTAILDKVETFDAEGLFHIPVVEQIPNIAEAYARKIATPMDLRTIRSERISNYRVISELQEDLILIFQNCCTFNRVKSQYWKYAFEIWENLNQIFIDSLDEKDLPLPRRFGR